MNIVDAAACDLTRTAQRKWNEPTKPGETKMDGLAKPGSIPPCLIRLTSARTALCIQRKDYRKVRLRSSTNLNCTQRRKP